MRVVLAVGDGGSSSLDREFADLAERLRAGEL
jgi:hypothetical protein